MAHIALPTLTDPGLLQRGLYIGGDWRQATNGPTLDVLGPATGETICSVATATVEDGRDAIDAAQRAFIGWSRMPAPKLANPRCGGRSYGPRHSAGWASQPTSLAQWRSSSVRTRTGSPACNLRWMVDTTAV